MPALTRYIEVPAKSPMFDADWREHGYIDRVVREAAAWVESRKVAGPEARGGAPRRPHAGDPVRGAGHQGGQHRHGGDVRPSRQATRVQRLAQRPRALDAEVENGLLYGRGGADDGYAVYAAITAIEALDAQGIPRPRFVGLIESCEESGSFDLPAYLDVLKPRLGDVSLVVCLDSGAGNYDQLWLTTSPARHGVAAC